MPLHQRHSELAACFVANAIGLLWHLGCLATFAYAKEPVWAFFLMLALSILVIGLSSERSLALTRFGLALQVYLTLLLLIRTYIPLHWKPNDYAVLYVVLIPTQLGVLLHAGTLLLRGIRRFCNFGPAFLPVPAFASIVGLLLMLAVFELTPYPASLPVSTTSWLSFRLLVLHFALFGLCLAGLTVERLFDGQFDRLRSPVDG